MSGSTSSVVAVAAGGGGGGDGYRPPFTAGQWQELEHQALIYKYLVAGLPVPADLVIPIRRSLEALSATARFFHHPSLGYCSYYGKKFDPEPGRCRRTDGKKWRCSKDAYPDSKYCERHMHRGRNRSRKPVESQSTSQSLSTAMSHITTASSSGSGCYQSVSSGSFQNLPLYSVVNSEGLGFGSNVSKYQVESSPYGINNKEFRYSQGLTPDVDDHNYSSEASVSIRGLGMNSNIDGAWRLMPSQVPSSSLLKSRNDSYQQGNSFQLTLPQSYEPVTDAATAMSKQRQQHCFFGSEIGSEVPVKQEQHNAMRPFFDEWPKTRESWSDLDDENKNASSTTQLSISIPMASEFSTRSGCSPNDA